MSLYVWAHQWKYAEVKARGRYWSVSAKWIRESEFAGRRWPHTAYNRYEWEREGRDFTCHVWDCWWFGVDVCTWWPPKSRKRTLRPIWAGSQ